MVGLAALGSGMVRSRGLILASLQVERHNQLAVVGQSQAEVMPRPPSTSAAGRQQEIARPKRTPGPIRADLVLLEPQPPVSPTLPNNLDGEEGDGPHLDVIPSVQGIAFLESDIPSTLQLERRTEIYTYVVQEGDTPAGIASLFGISLNTMLWANNLSQGSKIHPGDKLVVLPTTGISHRVARGDTVASIAKRYNASADDIIAFNNLPASGALPAGETVIVPDGMPPLPAQPRKPKVEIAQRDTNPPGWLIQPAPGRNWGRRHGFNGVDISNACGTLILAAAEGTVIVADNSGWNGGYGKYAKIQHPNGVVTLYAHAAELLVEAGVAVQQGENIALMGTSGRSTGCHVHFEVRGARNPFLWR